MQYTYLKCSTSTQTKKLDKAHNDAKIKENFAKNILKTKDNNKYFRMLKWSCKGLQKRIIKLER